MVKYTDKHKKFLEKLGTTLQEIQALNDKDEEKFIVDVLMPYICGDGTKEEEDLADDIIDLMKGD